MQEVDDGLVPAETRREAAKRTLARLLWSAQAEGLVLEDIGDSIDEALEVLRRALADSCAVHGWEMAEDSWEAFLAELRNSERNETLALHWRTSRWKPELRLKASLHQSIWSWMGEMDPTTEEAFLTWEVLASFDGHMTHPCSKTKLGLRPSQLLRTASEFEPTVPLVVGALAASDAKTFLTCDSGAASVNDYFASRFPVPCGLWRRWLSSRGKTATDFVPIPIHPANLPHVREDFASLLADGTLLLPASAEDEVACVLLGAPLMSCRTLLPLGGGRGGHSRGSAMRQASSPCAPYLKLPVPIQMTSLRRYLSPVEANGGPILSDLLAHICRSDAAIGRRLYILQEECAVHVHRPNVSYERARYLSCLFRTNLGDLPSEALPSGARVLPLAALLALDPLSARPVLAHVLSAAAAPSPPDARRADRRHEAAAASPAPTDGSSAEAWYAAACQVVLGGALRLWCCYGVTLELHQQNTLLVLDSRGAVTALVCREVAGGAYCYEPLLLANGHDIRPRLHLRQDAVFDKAALPLSILLHACFCQHLLPLADAVASIVPTASQAAMLATLRAEIRAVLSACAAEHESQLTAGSEHRHVFRSVLAETEHALLAAPTMRAKSLLHMRALRTKSELFTYARNPLLDEADGDRQVEEADGIRGHLGGFPLPWRPLHQVAGAAGGARREARPT